ncbi:MAG TPA: sucrase ferredoxin [Gaiellaceae bacterium]|nr:sucrase ferredoxin [Gaiellaceae bacterium]
MAVAVPKLFCADISSETEESLGATASHIENWILLEYRGIWNRDVLAKSLLSDALKAHLRDELGRVPRSRLLFIRQPDRRRLPRWAFYFGRTTERDARFFRLDFENHEDLLGFDFGRALRGGGDLPGVPLTEPLFVVCAHGKRDRCCALYGRPLYEDLRAHAEPRSVWQSTHVGGDRFAGNVVCFPEGVYYGRVESEDVEALVEAHSSGEILLERYRGRSCYPFAVQAAELAVRTETGLRGLRDLELQEAENAADGSWRVRFLAVPDEQIHELEVAPEVSEEAVYLTCNADVPRRVRRFVTREHRALSRA